jgi:hypothetical protein
MGRRRGGGRRTWLLPGFCLSLAYLVSGGCGLLVLLGWPPSPSLAEQGGRVIIDFWAIQGVVAALFGLVGLLFKRWMLVVAGSWLAASASLTWGASLILQALTTQSATPLTAACMAATLSAVLAQHGRDVIRMVRGGLRE